MKKITTLLLALLLVIPAMAATMTGGEVLYLTPNENWKQGGARFAAYFFGTGNTWASMTAVEGETDLYEVTVPSGSWTNVIFCRMNPSTTANNWNNKWNQTSDLTYDGTKNHYTVKEGTWDKGGGTWSTYTPPTPEIIEIPEGLVYYEGEFSIFVVNNKKWSTVQTYVWNGGTYYAGTWPGTAMTKVEDVTTSGYDCYKWTYTGSLTTAPANVIFNNGSDQTDDLDFVNGGVYTVSGGYLGAVEATPVVEPTVSISGDTSPYVGDEVTYTASVLDGDGLTVAFYVNGEKQTVGVDGKTFTYTAPADNYTVQAKLLNGENVEAESDILNVTVKEHVNVIFTVTVPEGTENVNIGGTFNGWSSTATPMTNNGNNVFTVTIQDIDTETIQYKYVTNQSWENVEMQADGVTDVVDRTYNENDVVAAWKGITTDPVEPETETLTYNVTVPAGTPACYIVGDFNEWGAFVAMTMVDETHYTITLDNVTKSMKYKYTASESWDNVEMKADGVTDVDDRTYSENDVVVVWKGIDPEPETLTYNVTVPAGTPACYISGAMNSWSFTAMTMVDETHYTITFDNVTKAMEYKYTASDSWDNVEMQADGESDVANRTYSENDVVAAWKNFTYYEEKIVSNMTYGVAVGSAWDEPEGCWYAAKFVNLNTDAYTWAAVCTTIDIENGHGYRFYLSAGNTPITRAKAENDGYTYTHVEFVQLPSTYTCPDNIQEIDLTGVIYKTTGEVYYDGTASTTYDIATATWKGVATGIDQVEAAQGIAYAYGVVAAEGAIEVYNMSGVVVARGNDNVDLRGLNAGVYVVRCGDAVRKVVR